LIFIEQRYTLNVNFLLTNMMLRCTIFLHKQVIVEGGENLMKKVIALVLSLMLLVAFTVGCKPAETPKPEEPKPAAEAPAPAATPAPEKPAEAPAPAPAPAHK
jgi:hypothetical protein